MTSDPHTLSGALTDLKRVYAGRLHELAEKIGVSRSTVSVALNRGPVGDRTLEDLIEVWRKEIASESNSMKDDSPSYRAGTEPAPPAGPGSATAKAPLRRFEVEFQNLRVAFDYADREERKELLADARAFFDQCKGVSSTPTGKLDALEREVLKRERPQPAAAHAA